VGIAIPVTTITLRTCRPGIPSLLLAQPVRHLFGNPEALLGQPFFDLVIADSPGGTSGPVDQLSPVDLRMKHGNMGCEQVNMFNVCHTNVQLSIEVMELYLLFHFALVINAL
jgi:hypothetical protein